MEFGVISKSLAAIRREPSETSEMVTQMLFGESFRINEIYKGWLRITGHFDGYPGWVDSRLTSAAEENVELDSKLACSLFKAVESNSEFPITLCPGAVLGKYKNGSFYCGHIKYSQIENPFLTLPSNKSEIIDLVAKKYINSPYLWGGRSPFGIDCSGLVQIVYRIAGINLPRDASQQALIGSTVEYVDNVKSGDLAFFDNEEGAITHVGIISNDGLIIHSSGYVKIDRIDHQGIFNAKANLYTHKLRVIKRIF